MDVGTIIRKPNVDYIYNITGMKIKLNRINKVFHFEGETEDKLIVNIDGNPSIGGEGKGVRPMELVLMGLAGCASIDIGLILKKQRLVVDDYQVAVSSTRNDDEGKSFKTIELHFIFTGELDDKKINRAIDLALTKYCSVALSLNENIELNYSYIIK